MKIRRAEDVIDIAKRRGFTLRLEPGPPPMPVLRGDKNMATPALMEALKAWRVEIIEIIAKDDNASA